MVLNMNDTTNLKQRLIPFARIAVVVLVIGLVLFFIFRTKPIPTGETYTASDIVYTNIQQPQTTKSGAATFFTGSAQAQIALTNQTRQLSATLTRDVPLENPDKAVYDETTKSLVVSVQYTNQSEAFKLSTSKPGIYWVIIQKDKNPQVINPGANQTLDAVVSNGVLYGLTVEDNKLNNLYSYNLQTGSSTVIAKNISSNSLVGATSTSVVTREQNGTVVIYSSRGTEVSKTKNIGSVIYDPTSQKLININDDVSRKNYKITVYDANNGKKVSSTKTPYRYIYVSSGMIYATETKSRPVDIISYDQRNLQATRHPLQLVDTRSKDAILSIVTLKKKPLTLGVVGSSNSMFLITPDKKYANSIASFQYPYFKSSFVGNTTIQSVDGTTDVTLKTDLSNIPQSILDLKTSCSCDVNQLSKSWQSNAVTIEDGE